MNFAIILAGGSGTRMKSSRIPKQFMELKEKPIIVHTVEKFKLANNIYKIIIPCKEEWVDELSLMLKKYDVWNDVDIIKGGDSRNDSIRKSINYIKKKYNPKPNDIILTHDAVRPFISLGIIDKNILVSSEDDVVVDTCVKSIDTIVQSNNSMEIVDIPDRNFCLLGQTPQSAKYKIIKEIYEKEYDEYLFSTTDLCKLALLCNYNIKIVDGDYFNIKITTDFDIHLSEIIVGEKYE